MNRRRRLCDLAIDGYHHSCSVSPLTNDAATSCSLMKYWSLVESSCFVKNARSTKKK